MALLYWSQNSHVKKGALAELKTAPYEGSKQPKKGAKIGPLSMEPKWPRLKTAQKRSQNWPLSTEPKQPQ